MTCIYVIIGYGLEIDNVMYLPIKVPLLLDK